MKSTNHRRLASRTGGVWKNESLNESFGSRWANKVKRNAYYKNMKVFFELECMSTCCWGLPKPKYDLFITHNRGTLTVYWIIRANYVSAFYGNLSQRCCFFLKQSYCLSLLIDWLIDWLTATKQNEKVPLWKVKVKASRPTNDETT